MLITRKSIFAVLIALFVLTGFGVASAAVIGGLADNVGVATLPPTLNSYVAPTGIGDTLIYNYYNVDGGNVTFFTVVNTDSVNGIRARIRFKEAAEVKAAVAPAVPCDGSHELLDFDICLSANDMWTGVIRVDPATGGAMLCSPDTDTLISDLLVPDPNSNIFRLIPAAVAHGDGCVAFKFGGNNAVTGITAKMTLEGYFTIIGERTMEQDGGKSISNHAGCKPVNDTNIGAPTNSLFGNLAIINAAPGGASYSYDATAIANFAGGDLVGSAPVGSGTSFPDLNNGQDGLAGTNFILAKKALYSIYDVTSNIQTEFIITLPTKLLTGCVASIFTDNRVTYQFFNDQEQPTTGQGCAFSPCPQQQADTLPFEVNAVLPKIGNSIMPSQVEVLPLTPTAYTFGWFVVDLNATFAAPDELTPDHENPFPAVGPFANSFGWPALGLTFMDVKSGATMTFPMQFSEDVHLEADED
jgi:hypothetical protein